VNIILHCRVSRSGVSSSRSTMALTEEDIEAAFDESFEQCTAADIPEEIIDPLFEKLVWIDEKNGSFQVDEEAFKKIFQTNHPLRVHACIGHYATSSLISKLLEYSVATFDVRLWTSENLNQIFSSKSEGINQKCIVAWAKPIPGEVLDGKVVHHVFLDIWGQFETADPAYVILAGICTALTTSIVLIQKIELEVCARIPSSNPFYFFG